MDSFYVDLVSNASMKEYSENSISKFTNKLCQPLELNDEWEVAINEIFYPIKFKLDKKTVYYSIDFYSAKGKLLSSNEQKFMFQYNENDEIENLTKKFSSSISGMFGDTYAKKKIDDIVLPKLTSYKDEDQKYKVIVSVGYQIKNNKKIIFILNFHDDNFLAALGFEIGDYEIQVKKFINNLRSKESISMKTGFIGSNSYDLSVSTNLMFIYSDIIKPHLVGDSYSKLFRVAPLSKGIYDEVAHITFSNTYYYDICKNRIEDISILLCDETGTQLKFESGRTFINLHFRKKL